MTRGHAPDALLDSYEAERRPVGAFNVEWALNAFFNHVMLDMAPVITHPGDLSQMQSPAHVVGALTALFADSPNGRMRRQRLNHIYDTQHIEFYARDVELGFVYPAGAFTPDGSLAPQRDPMGQDYRPVSRPGHRLPHAWVDHQGRSVSTHDFTGREGGFALICGERGTAWAQAAEGVAAAAGVRLTVAMVGSQGNVRDTESRWSALSGISAEGALLVRPDNVVGFRSVGATGREAADLQAALARCLGAEAPL